MPAQYISQLMKSVEYELAIADRQASIAQLKAWEKFSLHHDFPNVAPSVYEGWEEDRFLDWQEVNMQLSIKPKFSIRYFLKHLFNRTATPCRKRYKLASAKDTKAISVTITFTKKAHKIDSHYNIESQ